MAPTVAPAARAIPFKTGPALDLSSVAHVLLACILLLGLFALAAYVARRCGWLRRFAVLPSPPRPGTGLEVRRVQRLSTQTTLFVLAHGDQEFLLVESARPIALHPLAPTTKDGAS